MKRLTTLLAVVATSAVAGCGEPPGPPCVGKITKTFTTTSVSGGYNNLPASSSTSYRVAIKRDDGTGCERKLKKDVWLTVEAGQYVDEEGNIR